MTRYRISSNGGEMGDFLGWTKADAFVGMLRDAGYAAADYDPEHDAVIWPDEETREVCGDIWEWEIEEVAW